MRPEPVFPPVFQERMQRALGNQWADFRAAHAQPASTSVRKNPAKKTNFAESSPVPWAQHGRYLSERPVFTLDPLFHAGAYYVQEASSMFLEQAILQAMDLEKSLTVLDLCAAPGGKSTHILSLLNKESLLVSNETIRSRAGILSENLVKWGNSNVVVTSNDPAAFAALTGFFDVVVIDAPCSGEGLFRKEPTAMTEWSEENIALCAARQKRIVHEVWPSLKAGGTLVYSTCTYNSKENEDIIAQLTQLGGVCVQLKLPPEWGIDEVIQNGSIGYRFFPHRLNGEGFYQSVIRKTAEEESIRVRPASTFSAPPSKVMATMNSWIINPDEKKFIFRNDQVQFFPRSKAAEVEFLAKHLYLLTAGTVAAAVKHDKCVPDHGLALSVELNLNAFDAYALDQAQALSYLRKDNLSLAHGKKGYALVTFKDTALGWINVLDNRINNLYPSSWRIRMTP